MTREEHLEEIMELRCAENYGDLATKVMDSFQKKVLRALVFLLSEQENYEGVSKNIRLKADPEFIKNSKKVHVKTKL